MKVRVINSDTILITRIFMLSVRFQTLTAATVMAIVSWDVTPYSLVDMYVGFIEFFFGRIGSLCLAVVRSRLMLRFNSQSGSTSEVLSGLLQKKCL
jgi:hypothetical protein